MTERVLINEHRLVSVGYAKGPQLWLASGEQVDSVVQLTNRQAVGLARQLLSAVESQHIEDEEIDD